MRMNHETTTLSTSQPFSLKATVLSHGWHECSPMSWSEGGRCFQLIERQGDAACRVSVLETSKSGKSVKLGVTVEGPDIDDAFVDEVCGRLRLTLGLDRDVTEFHQLCADDPVLWVVPRIGGGRGIRSASMTENIVKAICGTNVTWSQAVKMINRIGQLGPAFRHFVNLNAWPTPREIIKAGEKYLLEVARVGYRAGSILEFCERVESGDLDPDGWDELAADPSVSTDALLTLLKSVRGIGPSSAHYLLSFLGRHDRLSIDSATVAHVARTHTNGKKPAHKKIEKIYAKYGPWKQSAWWYEHWLTWETGKQIVREAGLDGAPNA